MLAAGPLQFANDTVLWSPDDALLTRERKRWSFIRRVARDFDVVHFNFGRTLAPPRLSADDLENKRASSVLRRAYQVYASVLEMLDLRLLHRAGLGIVVSFQGSDARQASVCGELEPELAGAMQVGAWREADRIRRRRIKLWDEYAHVILAHNPDLLRVLPERATFLPYSNVDLADWPLISRPRSARPVILHAPTNRRLKGTQYILQAVEQLQTEGHAFEFLLVENNAHDQARRLYERADLLIDQVLLGWYGGLAVELLAMGKPVMCFIRDADLRHIPSAMAAEMPILRASPRDVADVLRHWLARAAEPPDAAAQRRAFVARWHDPLKIARRMEEHYRHAVEIARSRA